MGRPRRVTALIALLVEDATFSMPPHRTWLRGGQVIVGFIARTGRPDLRHVLAPANGQPAVAWYRWTRSRSACLPTSIEVLGLDGTHVKEITAFASPRTCSRFDLRRSYLDAVAVTFLRRAVSYMSTPTTR